MDSRAEPRVKARKGLAPSAKPPGSWLLAAGSPWMAYLQLTTAMAIVGSAVVVGKLIVAGLPVMLAAGLTSAIAGAVLVPLLLIRERGIPAVRRRDLGIILAQAFTGSFLWRIVLFYGLTLTTAAESGIITSTTPAAVGLLSFLLLGERLTRTRWIGIALAVLGILAINVGAAGAERGPNPVLGNLLIFASVLGEASFTICGKAVTDRVKPLTISALVTVFTLLMFLPFSAYQAATFDFSGVPNWSWASLVYFGLVLNVVAFNLWFRGIAQVPASTAAVFTGVLPVSALLLSYLVLREPFAWSHPVGMVCVLLAIVLIARGEAGPRSKALAARGG